MSIISATERSERTERPGALTHGRLGVPWKTVLPLAVVMAFADGYWLTSLRGAVGAIERTQAPFASWLRESTLVTPLYTFAVVGALTLALRWFGPELRRSRAVLATLLLIVAAGTLVGIAVTVASSAYDYHLQMAQLQMMDSMRAPCGDCLAQEQQATLALHVRSLIYISRWILLTNLVLVVWVVAMWGGRLKVSTTKRQQDGTTDIQLVTGSSRVQDIRLLLVGALVACAVIHVALVPGHRTDWAGVFFVLFAMWELSIAYALIARLGERTAVLAAVVISFVPLALWLLSRTYGLPIGPEAGGPVGVGWPDSVAAALEVGSLLAAVVLLRAAGWLGRRPPASAHVRSLVVVGLVAVTAIGVAGTGLSWFDALRISGSRSVMEMDMPH
jgi:hypothetical protein